MKYSWRDTEHYIKIYAGNPNYGSDRRHFIDYLSTLIQKHDVASFFDFGCGLNHVVISELKLKYPGIKYVGYDPALQDFQCNEILNNYIPSDLKIDMLISSDCLEHVHTEELPQVWEIFRKLEPRVMYHSISTRIAGQILSDGTNAHKTVKSDTWWYDSFTREFKEYTTINLTTDRNRQNNVASLVAIR